MLNVIFQRAGKEYLSDDVTHSTFQLIRSSPPEVFCKKGVLKNFAKLTGKHLCQRLWHWCFPVTFAKVLRTALFIEHLQWLLLMAISCLMCQTLCFYANKLSLINSFIFWTYECKFKICSPGYYYSFFRSFFYFIF